MDIDTAQKNIGKLVMSKDAGHKMIRSVSKQHGPYKLLRITKGGLAILEGREEFRIPPSLLSEYNEKEKYWFTDDLHLGSCKYNKIRQ